AAQTRASGPTWVVGWAYVGWAYAGRAPSIIATGSHACMRAHMIAVGGAGSSGLPALDNGNFIMMKISTAIAIRVLMAKGDLSSCGVWPRQTAAITNPHSASPAIKPEAASTPALSTRAFCASL